jgi:hypothetical protein
MAKFVQTCKESRAQLQFELPDMLKQRPKQFCNMLKQTTQRDVVMPIATFVKFNEEIFYDATITPDEFTPLGSPYHHHITDAELSSVLEKNFKAEKSTGFSSMPLHILKHMGQTGIKCLTTLLNRSAIEQLPPTQWRTSKVTPLYKGKGDATLPENYRSIAVAPPLSKLFMAIMNKRLTEVAIEKQLHAPTQAGFRAHHGTIE